MLSVVKEEVCKGQGERNNDNDKKSKRKIYCSDKIEKEVAKY